MHEDLHAMVTTRRERVPDEVRAAISERVGSILDMGTVNGGWNSEIATRVRTANETGRCQRATHRSPSRVDTAARSRGQSVPSGRTGTTPGWVCCTACPRPYGEFRSANQDAKRTMPNAAPLRMRGHYGKSLDWRSAGPGHREVVPGPVRLACWSARTRSGCPTPTSHSSDTR